MAKRKKTNYRLPGDWQGPRPTAALLGISPWTLSEYRMAGILKEVTHYRRVGNPLAARPTYRYHVRRCAELLGIEISPLG